MSEIYDSGVPEGVSRWLGVVNRIESKEDGILTGICQIPDWNLSDSLTGICQIPSHRPERQDLDSKGPSWC